MRNTPWIGNVLLVITTAINFELVIFYQRVSKGAWRRSSVGRHVMVFMATQAMILLVAVTRFILVDVFHKPDYLWFQILRSVVFLALPAVMLWRRVIIARSARTHNPVTWRESDGDHNDSGGPGEDLLPVPPVEREQRRRSDEDSGEPGGQEGQDADQVEGRRPRMGDGGQRYR